MRTKKKKMQRSLKDGGVKYLKTARSEIEDGLRSVNPPNFFACFFSHMPNISAYIAVEVAARSVSTAGKRARQFQCREVKSDHHCSSRYDKYITALQILGRYGKEVGCGEN